jgi:hypothetical protein
LELAAEVIQDFDRHLGVVFEKPPVLAKHAKLNGWIERAARCKIGSQAPPRAGIEWDFTLLPTFTLADANRSDALTQHQVGHPEMSCLTHA